MTSGTSEIVYGAQMPRLWTMPDRHTEVTDGCVMCQLESEVGGCGDYLSKDVISWAEGFGYEMDPWQKWVLTNSLGTNPDGSWASMENAIILSRQNGKGTVLEIRELGGLFVIGEGLIIHTAHEFKTSIEHFRRVKSVIDNYPALRRRVKHVAASHGDEAIELFPQPTLIFGSSGNHIYRKVGGRLRFLARSRGSGRGFSCDCLVYDEAMILTAEQVGASLPTMAARSNPQIYYMGSAGMQDSEQFGAVRKRIVRNTKDLFGAEWSIDAHNDSCPRDTIRGRETNYYIVCDRHDDRDNPKSWAKANPAFGYRLTEKFTRTVEFAGMPPAEFDRERLGVGEWPEDEESWSVISKEMWQGMTNENPGGVTRPVVIGADIDEDGKSATIVAAWDHKDGPVVLEIPKNGAKTGSDWVLDRMTAIYNKVKPLAVVVPKSGPGAALLEDAKKKWNGGTNPKFSDKVVALGPGDEAAAFAWFVQRCKDSAFWHFGEDHEAGSLLYHAVGRADVRKVGDGGKAWSRRDSESDITPITAATNAAYILNKMRRGYDPMKSIG